MTNKYSRRGVFGVAAGAGGVAAALSAARAQSPAPAQKQSKADAQYQDKPHDRQLCGVCAYFVAPSSC